MGVLKIERDLLNHCLHLWQILLADAASLSDNQLSGSNKFLRRAGIWQSNGKRMPTRCSLRPNLRKSLCSLISAPPRPESLALGWRPSPMLTMKFPPSSTKFFCPSRRTSKNTPPTFTALTLSGHRLFSFSTRTEWRGRATRVISREMHSAPGWRWV